MTAHFEGPAGLLTLHDWEALSEVESRRSELVDGVLVMTPSPTPRHSNAIWALTATS